MQILKLYERNSPEGGPDHVPANLAHHFLLSICTHPGTGICFKDRGWYPRDLEGEIDTEEKKSGKVHNKILANVLKILRVNEDLRQQELALRIMVACPELVAG
jgi:nucleolar pre-ribosomal-associated protein 1